MKWFKLKEYRVSIAGYPGSVLYVAASPGKARAKAWRDLGNAESGVTYRAFLGRSSVRVAREFGDADFGKPITVRGQAAFYVGRRGDGYRFCWPGHETIMVAHPLEVGQ